MQKQYYCNSFITPVLEPPLQSLSRTIKNIYQIHTFRNYHSIIILSIALLLGGYRGSGKFAAFRKLDLFGVWGYDFGPILYNFRLFLLVSLPSIFDYTILCNPNILYQIILKRNSQPSEFSIYETH
jgi:hypothetical protein